jgi:hypothetical protein
MVTTHQLERLRKDSAELSHYIHKLNKKGKTQLAFKVERKREYLDTYISDLANSTRQSI